MEEEAGWKRNDPMATTGKATRVTPCTLISSSAHEERMPGKREKSEVLREVIWLSVKEVILLRATMLRLSLVTWMELEVVVFRWKHAGIRKGLISRQELVCEC